MLKCCYIFSIINQEMRICVKGCVHGVQVYMYITKMNIT